LVPQLGGQGPGRDAQPSQNQTAVSFICFAPGAFGGVRQLAQYPLDVFLF
jgi:hypothetical protein